MNPVVWQCTHCGRSLNGRLVCPCFEARADAELFRLAIARFRAGECPLYMTPAPWYHLLATHNKGLTFCGEKRYSQAQTRRITTEEFYQLVPKQVYGNVCAKCHAKALALLDAALAEHTEGA